MSFDAKIARHARQFTPAARQMLVAMGCPEDWIDVRAAAGDFGRVRCVVKDGRWHEQEDGAWRLTVAVREASGEVVDIVALSAAEPDAWALWTGDGWALGQDVLADAEEVAEWAQCVGEPGIVPLCVLATPIDWLRFSGGGICVLDWSAMALHRLRMVQLGVTLACPTEAEAEQLQQMLAWGGLPEVVAANKVVRRAA